MLNFSLVLVKTKMQRAWVYDVAQISPSGFCLLGEGRFSLACTAHPYGPPRWDSPKFHILPHFDRHGSNELQALDNMSS